MSTFYVMSNFLVKLYVNSKIVLLEIACISGLISALGITRASKYHVFIGIALTKISVALTT